MSDTIGTTHSGGSRQPRIQVVVVDDHDLLRQGVIKALERADDIEIVGEAQDGASGIAVVEEIQPQVVLMDLVMPAMSGVEAIRCIKERVPATQVVALTSYSEADLVREALAAGATSYVMKNVNADALVDAVRTTAKGQSTLAPEITRELVFGSDRPVNNALAVLTEREVEVAELLSQGLSNAQIAGQLNRSLYTVKNHVSNVLMKLNVRSRTEAAALMFRHRTETESSRTAR